MNIRERLGHYKKRIKKLSKPYCRNAQTLWDSFVARFSEADIAIFHKLLPPPMGGSSQFVRALEGELERRGFRVEINTISATTRACLFNASSFDHYRLRKMYRKGCRMVQRIDGPVGVYRGYDDGTDAQIQQLNAEFADATIFQSEYSLKKHEELGFSFVSPCVIMNAVDPIIFHAQGRIPFDRNRKIRIISSSWSDNPKKGATAYKWLEDHLDWDRFDYTFVGRSQITFERLHMIPPLKSEELSDVLRQHDIYITASQDDPCSNALLEALACGLPAVYLNSGGHPEIVKEAGLGFEHQEEIPDVLQQLVGEYEDRQQQISIPTLSGICDQYLAVMGLLPS